MTDKRKRGRPLGDGKDDESALMAIAVKLVSKTAKNYREAAEMVYETHKPKGVHLKKTEMDRWRGKWKTRSAELMAKARMEETRMVRRASLESPPLSSAETLRQIYHDQAHVMLKQMMIDANPVEQIKQTLRDAGLSMSDLQALQKQALEIQRDPVMQDALKRIQSGEMQAAIAAFRAYQV